MRDSNAVTSVTRVTLRLITEERGRDEVHAARVVETGKALQLGRLVFVRFKHSALGQCPRHRPWIETTAGFAERVWKEVVACTQRAIFLEARPVTDLSARICR